MSILITLKERISYKSVFKKNTLEIVRIIFPHLNYISRTINFYKKNLESLYKLKFQTLKNINTFLLIIAIKKLLEILQKV